MRAEWRVLVHGCGVLPNRRVTLLSSRRSALPQRLKEAARGVQILAVTGDQ
jgi:hypothetical protein